MRHLISVENITKRIYHIRGYKVLLDRDIAELYEVETKRLKEQVRRNIERFPSDFMFELNKDEFANWRSQIAASNSDKMGLRYAPMAFTEQGVAMLSSVLRSKRAIQVNVQIMRAFVRLRQMVLDHAELKREVDELRKQTDERFQVVFTVLDKLVNEGDESRKRIGFIENGK
jgi:ORF6N domain